MNKTALTQAICLTCALATPLAANAGEVGAPSLYHIYIGALFTATDSERQLVDYGRGFTGAFGMPIRAVNNLSFELGASQQVLKTPDSLNSNFFRQELTGSLMYSFGNRDELTPYVIGGIGVARNDTIALDETNFTAHLGMGATRLFGDFVRGRVELKGNYDTFADQDLFEASLSAGVEVPLGRTKEVEVVRTVIEPAQIIEKQVEVIKEVVKEVAPPDSDGDHIADTDDKCPGTLADVRTDNLGCAIAQSVTLQNIEFDLNKASLKQESGSLIEQAANFFKQQPNLRAVIAGHTDDIGKDASNLTLSQARANTVVKALVNSGLDAKRFKAVGLGESMPAVANTSDESRARNRRVEFLLSTSEAN
ncbi:MAG: OmpA family protein [Pseudomonadota bacterium]